MDNQHLTDKQMNFFFYVVSFKEERFRFPTYKEIMEKFEYASPNSVTQNLDAIVSKGYLDKEDGVMYSITEKGNELLRLKRSRNEQ